MTFRGPVAQPHPSPAPGPHESGILAAAAQPDWLYHTLAVSGPPTVLSAFTARARGAAAIPWELDLDAEEHRLLARMRDGGEAARQLARDLRLAVEAHHRRALAQSVHGRLCPFDLHRLVPVPEAILMRGPDDPDSRRWLWEHWGTLWPLRRVRLAGHPDRRARRTARVTYEFFAADWTPWRAIVRLRAEWPALAFDIRPHYDDG